MKRRNFISLVGGGVVLAAGAGFAGMITRDPKSATLPWQEAGTYSEPRKRALSYAILAPNPHNRQPWMVDLSVPDRIRLFVDTTRMLPHTDPFNRQITIGLGCFLETLALAAANDAIRTDITLFPEGSAPDALDDRPVADIILTPDSAVKPDPLFAQIPFRRSVKEPYDMSKPVPESALAALRDSTQQATEVRSSNEPAMLETLRGLTFEALLIELKTPHTYKESVDLMRIGKAEVEANPDGISFTGPFFETLHLTGMMTREGLLDPNSTMFEQGITAVQKNAESAMAHVWQITPGNSREEQIAAGRDWMRLHLAATREGLSLQPMSQALQEYPEMEPLFTKTHEILAPNGGTLQMLARVGYAEPIAASPRWPLEEKLMKD